MKKKFRPACPAIISKHQDQIIIWITFVLLLVVSGPPLSSPWSRGGGWRFPLEPLVNQLEVAVRNQMYFSPAVSLFFFFGINDAFRSQEKDEIDRGWHFPLELPVCQLEVLLISCFSPAIFFSEVLLLLFCCWQCYPTVIRTQAHTFSQLNVLSISCFSPFLLFSSKFPIWNFYLGNISWTFVPREKEIQLIESESIWSSILLVKRG